MPRRFLIPTSDLIQTARGFLMGGADIIPGVSGGTVALILGIYDRLVTAISRFDLALLGHLKARDWKAAAAHVDFRFLGALGCGIALGIVGLAGLMNYLLLHHTFYTFAAFFGMIFASSFLVGAMVERWSPSAVTLLVVGAVAAYVLVGLPLLQSPPEGNTYVFFCGTVGICAMILPGISGSFILLLLGKYSDITGLIKSIPSKLAQGQLPVEELTTVLVFCAGCGVGLIAFSKILRWLLTRHHQPTMALLCGFMIGSLRKIWPFKIDTTLEVEEFKHKVFENIPVANLTPDARFFITIGIALGGAAVVVILDRVTRGHEHTPELPADETS